MGNYDRRKSTPCRDCLRCLKWIPVIFIVAIIGWSYYAYVFQLCLFQIDSTVQKIIFIALYHIVGVLFLWSYWNTIFTPVGTVPHKWRIPESEIERLIRAENQEQQKRMLENFAKDLPVTNRTLQGAIRFCEKCQIIKPDRAHHCSVCGTCVLKMDHHCPWVNNCVNFKNYKFFVLFLGYALLYCLYVALTSLQYFIEFWRGELTGGMGRFHILFLFFVSLMFAISLVSLFGYHIYLVLVNRTTLEAFRAPVFRIGGADKNGFNLGKYANFQEVFGDNWKLWLIPVYTSLGDGLTYPTQGHHQSSSYESMGDTQTRLDQPTDKFLNQPIDNLPALVNNDNGNADASLSSTNNAANNSNIANGNFIIDMPSSNNSSDHHAKIFVVNERIIDDASELNNQNQLLTNLDERNANTEAPESAQQVPAPMQLAGAPKTHEQNEQNPASIIDI